MVLSGCRQRRDGRRAAAGRNGRPRRRLPVSARIVRVEAVTVPQGAELYGTVEAERTAAVSSRVMATVTAVLVKPGDPVRAGQVLVEIDPATARGQEAQARGALAQAQAALALAERNFERFQTLAAKGAASQLELDVARMQYEQAKGAVTQGEGAVEAAASVARESRVVAPFDGRVAAKLVEVGDLAAPGRPLVMVESAAGRRLVLPCPRASSPQHAASRFEADGAHRCASVRWRARRDRDRTRLRCQPRDPHLHGESRPSRGSRSGGGLRQGLAGAGSRSGPRGAPLGCGRGRGSRPRGGARRGR